MNCKLEEDVPLGLYRSDDSIENLKIRVLIRKVAPACLPISESFGSISEFKLLQITPGNQTAFVEQVFSWHEKVFSHEVIGQNGQSIQEHSVPDADNECSDKISLFTYIDSEITPLNWQRKRLYAYPKLSRSCVTKVPTNTKRRILHPAKNKSCQKPFYPEAKEIVHNPSSENAPLYSAGQSMTIMAVLDSKKDEEIELCVLCVDAFGVLTVFPDFNRGNIPYTIQNSRSETFEYILEHVSHPIKECTAKKEINFLKKITHQHAKALATAVGVSFTMPSSKTLVVCLKGEIVSAENFPPGDILIRYAFQLPEGLKSANEESLCGVTYTCRTKKKEDYDVAYFGFPFNLDVELDLEQSSVEGFLDRNAQIVLEVTSVDKWGNCRNEGYGFCSLSLLPGCQVFNVKTWRLLPNTILGKLRNFFIGGVPYLDDLSYATIPNSVNDAQLSKYGIKTETSGSVTMKSHVLLQSCLENLGNIQQVLNIQKKTKMCPKNIY